MRRRFMRRVLVAVALLFGLLTAAVVVATKLTDPGGRSPPVGFALVLLVLALVLAGRWVRRMAGPVVEVMEAADRVAAGDLDARVQPRGPREVRRLGASFNQMTERLASNDAGRRALLADLAHELRTPLQVIRGSVEGMLDGLYPADDDHLRPVLEETAAMSRLLDDLQTLSTAEAGALRLHRESVAPSVIVEDAVASFRSRAADHGVLLTSQVTADLSDLDVDAFRIAEVLSNLVSNALRHTPRGGHVTVSAEPAAGAVAFAVTDTGDGIPLADLPHVFDRFVKSSDSGGAGLGLAIARSLVEAHGGTIEATNGTEGGAIFRFMLPAG